MYALKVSPVVSGPSESRNKFLFATNPVLLLRAVETNHKRTSLLCPATSEAAVCSSVYMSSRCSALRIVIEIETRSNSNPVWRKRETIYVAHFNRE